MLCQLGEIQNIPNIKENVPGYVEIVEKNEFFRWLNASDSDVTNIKEKMIKKGAIASINLSPMSRGEFFHKYWLDLICAAAITYFIHNTSGLEKFSSAGKGHKKLKKQMELIHKQFSSILLINDDAQKLFYLSLDFLVKRGISSPFLSGKGHSFLARDVMTKIVMYFIYYFIIPDFFIAHINELERIPSLKAFNEWEHKQGIVLSQDELYFVDDDLELQIIELKKQGENTELLKTLCSILPEDKLFKFYAFSSVDGAPKTFEACVLETDRSLMKFNMTDHFVIEASNAVAHRFFDSKIETPRRLQAMAKEMKYAVIKKKKRDSVLQHISVSELFSTNFAEIF
ncbi:hypothetical protein [Legionella santicrucis]|uniref:hypothetical protein n=1 Tax=Legionella santicrucis TaxID=45074 RepID=UPI0012EDB629|nr:hypothetical protein [Legionella santicrucis]